MSAATIPLPRQIDLAKIEAVLSEQRFTAGRYLGDAVGALAVRTAIPASEMCTSAGCVRVTDALLARVDRYSCGERWPGYGQHDFDNDCHTIDRVLQHAYGLLPCDRAAFCVANDAPRADGYRWVAVCAAVKARNLMLARGLNPDEVSAPMYRGGR
jgi:hypothetical protein